MFALKLISLQTTALQKLKLHSKRALTAQYSSIPRKYRSAVFHRKKFNAVETISWPTESSIRDELRSPVMWTYQRMQSVWQGFVQGRCGRSALGLREVTATATESRRRSVADCRWCHSPTEYSRTTAQTYKHHSSLQHYAATTITTSTDELTYSNYSSEHGSTQVF